VNELQRELGGWREAALPMAPVGPLPLPAARGWAWRVIQWPPCRLIVALVWILAVLWAGTKLLGVLPRQGPPGTAAQRLGGTATLLILGYIGYLVYTRVIEWRRAGELSLVGAGGEAAAGALTGFGLMAIAVGVEWLAGLYHVVGSNPLAVVLVPALVVSAFSGFFEELLLRVIFFRILEEPLGTAWALALSSLLFGLLHLRNPHAGVVSTVSIVAAGALLGGAFAMTRRIWFAAALHGAWNFTQGGIFGVPVSGIAVRGLLKGSLNGPETLSGGVFGIEGSPVAVVLCVAAAVVLLRVAVLRRRVVAPVWARRTAPGEISPAPDAGDMTGA
jgi:membrane protease YdiL (CAAX protease family)